MRFQRAARAGRASRSHGPVGGAGGGAVDIGASIMALSPAQYLPLSGTAPTAYADVSGNGRNGTAVSTPVVNDVLGPDGNSYIRLGAGTGVNAGYNAIWGGNTVRTHMIAFRPTVWDGTSLVLSQWRSNTLAEHLLVRSGTSIWVYLADSNGNLHRSRTLSTVVNVNKWNFVTFAPRSGTYPDVRLNGATLGGVHAVGGGFQADWNSPLRIGQRDLAGAVYLTGAAAHYACIPRQLTEGEYTSLFADALAAGWIEP